MARESKKKASHSTVASGNVAPSNHPMLTDATIHHPTSAAISVELPGTVTAVRESKLFQLLLCECVFLFCCVQLDEVRFVQLHLCVQLRLVLDAGPRCQ